MVSIICSLLKEMDPLKSDLRHSIGFVLSRGNDRFQEGDNGIGYLVTHLDRVFYIPALASSLFNIPPQLECLLQRACLLFLVAVTTHCKGGCLSLQDAGVVPA